MPEINAGLLLINFLRFGSSQRCAIAGFIIYYLVRDRFISIFTSDAGGQILSFFFDANGFKFCPPYGMETGLTIPYSLFPIPSSHQPLITSSLGYLILPSTIRDNRRK
jgi:hypothetical protein